jgi:RimJ/RimL family protein N-acetyltransferase
MHPRTHQLKDGRTLLIREAAPADAAAILDYIDAIASETDYLSFGPGEFGLTEEQEADILRRYRTAGNGLYIVGVVNNTIVSTLNFNGGQRPRTRHTGEFGVSVRKPYRGIGIGARMLDALIAWAADAGSITKINLRVRTDNHRAIRLYERKGFIREGTISREMRIAGEYYDHYWMGLEL